MSGKTRDDNTQNVHSTLNEERATITHPQKYRLEKKKATTPSAGGIISAAWWTQNTSIEGEGGVKPGEKPGKERNLYEPISSAVNAAANAKPRSSAARVCANEARSTFERTTSLRPSVEASLASAGVVSGKRGQSARDVAKVAAAAAVVADEASLSSYGGDDADADADADDEVPTEEIADVAAPP
jgi:hypothetical protein